MSNPLPPCITPDVWLRQVFSSHQALEGGVVRRKVRDVERIVGRDAFETYLRQRGFRAVENAGQYVVFCNRGPVRVIE
ncbi:MAG: N-(5'-phosphoribosyl)anthranilate isomerase [Rhodobacteraceae bacterium]|jgi:hypothetical protein|nr:N-(5'-phosphoribosyl)anthranilate isomerase [Paracoccaceae bacterium]